MARLFLNRFSFSGLLVFSIFGFLVFFLLGDFSFNSFKAISSTPRATPTLVFPKCADHDPSKWHGAAQKDSSGKIICVYGHEHGDAPPLWVGQAGFNVGFDQMGGFASGTSEMENTVKHVGMKGFEATIKGVAVYARIHLMSNPLDRSARYHSYELFLKDKAGGISHFQGWLNTGDPAVDRIPYQDKSLGEAGKDPGRRPIVWAATRQACVVDRTWCIELWTMTTSAWGPKISWGINDATTFLEKGTTGITSTTGGQTGRQDPGQARMTTQMDMTSWDVSGSLGVDRSLTVSFEPTWGITGKIWATQFGEIVQGPFDAKCQENTVQFGTVYKQSFKGIPYKNVCLENFIAPTLSQISGTGNTIQKDFENIGVEFPN